jgi:N-methylhydantoinase B
MSTDTAPATGTVAPAAPATPDYDVLGVEVHRKAMDEIAREIGITLVRTSGSPVVTEAKDLSCAILDESSELVGFSGFVGFHVSTSALGVEAVLRNYDLADIRPGDAFIANDPHSSGAIHQGDVGVIMPYFHDDELIGWGYVNAHLLDVGGSSVSGFAPEARESFAEALAFPAVRFVRDGKLSHDWALFIANSVRVPVPVLNDLRSMIAALNAGKRRLDAVIASHGLQTHREYCRINKALSEQLIRSRIAELPDGEYVSKEWIEYDGHGTADLYELGVAMTVRGDEIDLRFHGVDQVPAYVNGARPSVLGNAMNALQTVFIPDVPVNAALWRAIHFDLGPAGSIVNSVPPAPVSQSHMECGMRITRLMSDVLAQAMALSPSDRLRSRVAGQPNNGIATCTLTGADRRTGQPIVIFPIAPTVGLGGPAQSVSDGVDTYSGQFNIGTRMAAVEVDEAAGPMVTLWRRIEASNGGAGQMRGGQGMTSALAMRGIDSMTGTAFNSCAEVPPRGSGGGQPGAGSDYHVVRGSEVNDLLDRGAMPTVETLGGTTQRMPSKTGTLTLREGDVFVVASGGGGGLGDPLLRDPAAVAKDVADGYTDEAAAREVYGVVLDGAGADEAATDAQRLRIRTARIGAVPPREIRDAARREIGVAVRVVAGRWTCGCCGEDLGDVDDNYRAACVATSGSAASTLGARGTRLRSRTVGPDVLLTEYFCRGCGLSVRADVGVEGDEVVPAPRLTAEGRRLADRAAT